MSSESTAASPADQSAKKSKKPAAKKSSRTPLVQAVKLEVGYQGEPVCAPVSFAVYPGDAMAIVGPNGAGKSTILRAILGLLEPVRGDIYAFGRPVDEREAFYRARVAGVLDEDAYFPALTVSEHLTLTSRGHGVEDASEIVEELLEDFGLDGHANVLPTALSSGQRRRLLLAAAFARPRVVVVLDEPEQRLDQAMRADLAERLVAEREGGHAVVFATHDPDLLRAVATTAVIVGDHASTQVTPEEAASAIEEVL